MIVGKKHSLGRTAEQIAVIVLISRGMAILKCNYRCKVGEVDVIAQDGHQLVFVEVRSINFGGSVQITQTLPPSKISQVNRVAQYWLNQNRMWDNAWRVDFVGVEFGMDYSCVHYFACV